MGLAPSASAASTRFRAPSPQPNAQSLTWEEISSHIGTRAFEAAKDRALGALRTVVHWAGVVVSIQCVQTARAKVRMNPRLFDASQEWDIEAVLPRGVPETMWKALENEVVDFVGKIVSVQPEGAPTVLLLNARIYDIRSGKL